MEVVDSFETLQQKRKSEFSSQKHRSTMDIIYLMLGVLQEPCKSTHVLYRVGINYYQWQRYRDALLGAGMIESRENHTHICTAKGKVLMEALEPLYGKF